MFSQYGEEIKDHWYIGSWIRIQKNAISVPLLCNVCQGQVYLKPVHLPIWTLVYLKRKREIEMGEVEKEGEKVYLYYITNVFILFGQSP